MSEQRIGLAYDKDVRTMGDLVVGIRKDDAPAGEADRLAEDGDFYPVTLDKNGNLRVTIPAATKIDMQRLLQVNRENNELLTEIRDLLRIIAPRG